MTTAQLEVSILAAPLAAMDPRALSQAWYSALRLARAEQAPALGARLRPPAVPPPQRRLPNQTATVSPKRFDPPAPRGVTAKPAGACTDQSVAHASNRRTSAPPLAERIERTFSQPYAGLKRATFSTGPGRARVHVILQTNGETTTLLALYRPEMRSLVARALMEVRFALGRRGIAVQLDAKEVRTCF